MALLRKIIVFDFETDSPNPETCQPVQLAAIAIDPRNLKIVKNSQFSSFMKPEGIDKDDYLTPEVTKCIEWHAKNQKRNFDDILADWKTYPSQKLVWESFHQYCMKFNKKENLWQAPIPCGANIRAFDLVICKRLNEKYDKKVMFWERDMIDVQHLAWLWLSWIDGPENIKMDTLKDHFGFVNEDRHDALQDVKEEAWFACKFLGLHQYMAPLVKWKDISKEERDAFNGRY
jgi:DNA polymerase III epsilon subunit-like protein